MILLLYLQTLQGRGDGDWKKKKCLRRFGTDQKIIIIIIIIIIDNFCIALFSGVPKLTELYILQHFLGFTNIIHIIMTTNNV